MERMYNFINARWNPLGGACPHACSYCYVNQMKKRFKAIREKYSGEPRLIESEFKNLGHGKTYFVCSMIDLFADRIPAVYIQQVLGWCMNYDNEYFFQTKNPFRFNDFNFPIKSIKCVTIESNYHYGSMGNSIYPLDRINSILFHKIKVDQITIEPIMYFNFNLFVDSIKEINPQQVNIGADSGKNGLPEPSKEKVLQLISELEKFTVVNKKETLKRLLK